MSEGEAAARSSSAGATTSRRRQVPARVEAAWLSRWTTGVADGGAARSAGGSSGAGQAWATRPSGCTSSRTTRAGAFTVTRIASVSPGPTRGGVPAGWPSSASSACPGRSEAARQGDRGGPARAGAARSASRPASRAPDASPDTPAGPRRRRPAPLQRSGDRRRWRAGEARRAAAPTASGSSSWARTCWRASASASSSRSAFLLDERVEERLVVEGRSQQLPPFRVGERVGGVAAEQLLRVAGHRPPSPATKPQRSPSSFRRRWWQRKSQL